MSRILVIDDERCLREMVRMALAQRGFDVVEAESGAEGVEVARSHPPDLVLCDVNMGNMDGYLTLSNFRKAPETAAIPFILMTGMANNAGMRQGMELGADDYLPKPFTIDGLYAAVEARLKKTEALRQQAEKKLSELRTSISMMLPHELRTPLNGILAYAELLATESPTLSVEEVGDMGKVIYDSGKRLERLVENFLIYAQIELIGTDAEKIRDLRLGMTRSCARVIRREAEKQAEQAQRQGDLVLDLNDASAAISEEHLGRIAGELLRNAFKFSQTNSAVFVSLQDHGDSIHLSVTDQGRGFSTEHLTRIGAYMQFDRKLNEQQGVGLGLTIVKRLAELHGGSFSVASRGRGGAKTSVVVKLPKTA